MRPGAADDVQLVDIGRQIVGRIGIVELVIGTDDVQPCNFMHLLQVVRKR